MNKKETEYRFFQNMGDTTRKVVGGVLVTALAISLTLLVIVIV